VDDAGVQGFPVLFDDVEWRDGLYVAVGNDIAVSPRGVDWMFLGVGAHGTGAAPLLQRVAGNGRIFVAFARYGEIFIAYDGVNWYGGATRSGSTRRRNGVQATLLDAGADGGDPASVLRRWAEQAGGAGPAGIIVAIGGSCCTCRCR